MIYQQSVFETWPIENETIQAIICSPPYYALRRYQIPDIIIGGDKDCKHEFGNKERYLHRGTTKSNKLTDGHITDLKTSDGFCIHCNAWKGQYGLEPTPQLYVEHVRLWAKEAWRVLKPDGVFFLNLGDSYSTISGNAKMNNPDINSRTGMSIEGLKNKQKIKGYPSKCQLLIPHRVAVALIDDGWTLRNTIVWHKLNAMPESAKDRFSKKYEYIFMFTKQEKYYFDLDSVREPHKEVSIERLKRAVDNNNKWVNGADGQTPHGLSQPRPNINKPGANTGENNKEPYRQNNPHLLRIKEKEYKERVGSMQSTQFSSGDYLVANLNPLGKNPGDIWSIPTQPSPEKHYAMWPQALVERMIKCGTKAGDIVLDCFAGSGTTGKVAMELHREFIGIDLGYKEISDKRLSNIQKRLKRIL